MRRAQRRLPHRGEIGQTRSAHVDAGERSLVAEAARVDRAEVAVGFELFVEGVPAGDHDPGFGQGCIVGGQRGSCVVVRGDGGESGGERLIQRGHAVFGHSFFLREGGQQVADATLERFRLWRIAVPPFLEHRKRAGEPRRAVGFGGGAGQHDGVGEGVGRHDLELSHWL